ncbi:MAG: HAD-IIB family hydrolase [Magnetococcales bacterium]|nr:HAD-IIB family hydrolase [Magnetococcales bacterium]
MTAPILLCTDLDRTLLPNGPQPESPGVREAFARLVAREEVSLAYVSGRKAALIAEAIAAFDIPQPDFAVADVGTSIYRIAGGEWHPWQDWSDRLARVWAGRTSGDLAPLLTDLPGLRFQPMEYQNTFKLSFYGSPDIDAPPLLDIVRDRLAPHGIRASLVWSVDEVANLGFLDVLPRGSTKLGAVRFLRDQLGFAPENVLFAGDSGNDLEVLTSEVQAVLVANAREEVRRQALAEATAAGHRERLYLARGGFRGLNGNYAAGILEGLAHFIPQAVEWTVGAEP